MKQDTELFDLDGQIYASKEDYQGTYKAALEQASILAMQLDHFRANLGKKLAIMDITSKGVHVFYPATDAFPGLERSKIETIKEDTDSPYAYEHYIRLNGVKIYWISDSPNPYNKD